MLSTIAKHKTRAITVKPGSMTIEPSDFLSPQKKEESCEIKNTPLIKFYELP